MQHQAEYVLKLPVKTITYRVLQTTQKQTTQVQEMMKQMAKVKEETSDVLSDFGPSFSTALFQFHVELSNLKLPNSTIYPPKFSNYTYP